MYASQRIVFWVRVAVLLGSGCYEDTLSAWTLTDVGGGFLASPAMAGVNLYVASGVTVDVYDLTDPARPVLVDRTRNAPTPAPIRGTAVVGDTLYVAWSQGGDVLGGVSIFSLANPAHPIRVAELDGYPADELIASDSYVYLVGG